MVIGYFRRAYSSFVAHVFDTPARLLALLLFITLLLIPTAIQSPYYLNILIRANVLALIAVSWDLLVGRTGLISLGHALFFGIGGYATALLFNYYRLPVYLTIPIAVLVGVIAALIVGVLCLRVKGPYLALVTMAFPLILQTVVRWNPLSPIFRGELGIRPIPGFFPRTIDLPFASLNVPVLVQQAIGPYYLILIALFISAVIIYKIANSKTGLVFVSILDDELASKACGINVTKFKLLVFGLSGLFGAFAGALQAHAIKLANPPMFALDVSFSIIIVTFLGGIGTIYGPILGAYIYYTLDKYFLTTILPDIFEYLHLDYPPEIEQAKLLIFTVIVLILVIKWPRGIARLTTDKLTDLEEARDLDERGPRIWKRYKKKEKG